MNADKMFGNESVLHSAQTDAEATLRLVAGLPAPEGLEDRVHAALRNAPRRGGRVLDWPARPRVENPWMRSAAAAAIVFVVAGGGWGVYSRVQPARVIAMPPHTASPGGFSNAGAMRTPQTLNGPVVIHPAAAQGAGAAAPAASAQHVVTMPARHAQPKGAQATANPQPK